MSTDIRDISDITDRRITKWDGLVGKQIVKIHSSFDNQVIFLSDGTWAYLKASQFYDSINIEIDSELSFFDYYDGGDDDCWTICYDLSNLVYWGLMTQERFDKIKELEESDHKAWIEKCRRKQLEELKREFGE